MTDITTLSRRERRELRAVMLRTGPRFLMYNTHVCLIFGSGRDASPKASEYVRDLEARESPWAPQLRDLFRAMGIRVNTKSASSFQPGDLVVMSANGQTRSKVVEPGENLSAIFRYWDENPGEGVVPVIPAED